MAEPIQPYQIVGLPDGDIVCSPVLIAGSWQAAGIGLLGRSDARQRSLLLKNVGSVHTFGMRFALDLAFFDSRGRCLRRIDGLPPWRVALGPRGSSDVLETKARQPSVLEKITPGKFYAFHPQAKAPVTEHS